MNTPWRDVEELWDLERPVGVLGGDRPVAPGVAAGERDAPLRQPLGELEPGPGSPER